MDKLHEESRKQFERDIKSRGMSAMKRDGRYVDSATRFALDFWQASRASIVVDVPDADNYWNGTSGHEIFNHRQFAADTCDALRDIGLSIKGE
ncbi:hypothetical protein [Serratia liquefaciens]|uniref:hypothetical protein n=1 Tax=Serratia liquefaciens TaxID=614 RepID=UPI00165CF729|nr:hypothetical protein [Serratia liquefaciens]QNQ52588.1 hypothetical protein IAI46_15165 [Serratia liquefaciens]